MARRIGVTSINKQLRTPEHDLLAGIPRFQRCKIARFKGSSGLPTYGFNLLIKKVPDLLPDKVDGRLEDIAS
jgi:hypothetical protein